MVWRKWIAIISIPGWLRWWQHVIAKLLGYWAQCCMVHGAEQLTGDKFLLLSYNSWTQGHSVNWFRIKYFFHVKHNQLNSLPQDEGTRRLDTALLKGKGRSISLLQAPITTETWKCPYSGAGYHWIPCIVDMQEDRTTIFVPGCGFQRTSTFH